LKFITDRWEKFSEWSNRNSRGALILGIVLILAAGGFMYYRFFYKKITTPTGPKAWYTADDGASFFADDAGKVVPYTKDGKTVVRAHRFTCRGHEIGGYLEKYTDEAAAALNNNPDNNKRASLMTEGKYKLYKKPGEGEWINVALKLQANRQADSNIQFDPLHPKKGEIYDPQHPPQAPLTELPDDPTVVKCPGGDGSPSEWLPQ
jgi:hypothetical protein